MRKRIAFTMSEAMIVLGIVAVLATLSVIAVNSAKPDENIIMFRRAYGTTLKVVQNLMSDSQLYPNATVVAYNDVDSNLNPLWQKSLASTCSNEYLTGSIDIDKSETSSRAIDNDMAYEDLTNCGSGGGGGGGSSTTSNGLQTGTVSPMTGYCARYNTGVTSSSCATGTSNYAVCKSDCSYTCTSDANSYYDDYGNLLCVAPCSSNTTWSSTQHACVTLNNLTSSSYSSYSLSTNGMAPDLTSGSTSLIVSKYPRPTSSFSSTSSGDDLSSGDSNPSSGDPDPSSGDPNTSSGDPDPSSGDPSGDVPYDTGYNFDSLATTVFGKGFSDTEITESMKQRYPYLASATADNKFAYSFMSRLNPIEGSVSGNTATFTTADGIYWEVIDRFNTDNQHAMVTVKLNGNTNKACYYHSRTCQTPTKFTFKIAKSGKVTHQLSTTANALVIDSADPMACSYARYSSVTKNSKIPTQESVNSCFKGYKEYDKVEFDNNAFSSFGGVQKYTSGGVYQFTSSGN